MSCENCRDIERVDGIKPDCETDKGCRILPLKPDEARVLELRHRLIALRDIIDSGTVLRMYEATKEDIELLAIVEEELRDLNDKH